MRVVVTNAVVSNTGDAAIYQGIHQSLVACGVASASDITLLDSNAARTRELYPGWNILQQPSVAPPVSRTGIVRGRTRARREAMRLAVSRRGLTHRFMGAPGLSATEFARSVAALEQADVVISTGGTYLVDHYDFGFRLLELQLAAACGHRPYLWTQSAGPFQSSAARTTASQIPPLVEHIFARDTVSRQAFVSVGAAADQVTVAPDVAFCLARPEAVSRPSAPARVLISVRDWKHRGAKGEAVSIDGYRSALRAAARHLSDAGANVETMSTCQGIPGYVDDSSFAGEVFSGEDVCINREFHSPDDLMVQIQQSELVVTTRMHMAILALLCRVPVIAIGYEFKTMELFSALGLSEWAVAMEDVSPEWLVHTIDRALESPEDARLTAEAVANVRAQASMPAQYVGNRHS